MAVDYNKKYLEHNIAWIILNRLKDFNDKSQLIYDLAERFHKLKDHSMYGKFTQLYDEAISFFEKQNYFPDIKYLNERFPDGRAIMEFNNVVFSMDMYDSLKQRLDYEIIIYEFGHGLGEDIDVEHFHEYGKRMLKFAENNVEIPVDTKADWLNSYRNFKETYHGISTGIKAVDEQVGDFGGLVTIAAPSGNGKSTFALSLSYNVATQEDENGQGRNVLYISFEMTKFQLMANIVAIESSFSDKMNERLKSTNIKEKQLTEEEEELYEVYTNSFMQRLNHSHGYLSLIDNTAMNGYSTIEEFMASIEEHSAKVGRKFDIIIIDNVDSLKMLKGERGQDEMGKMNTFITKLDSFSKTYMDGYGTCIVLLSQTNREGLKKLKAMEANGSQEISIDFTVLSTYSALYERATMVLVLYSSALMRSNNQLKLMPVKLRNKPLPRQPLTLTTRWEYSYVGSTYTPPKVTTSDLTSMVKPDYNEDEDDDFGMVMGVEDEEETPTPSEPTSNPDLPWDEDLDSITLEDE